MFSLSCPFLRTPQLEQLFPGARLSDGPAIPQEGGGLGGGFFYDVWLPERQSVSPQHIAALQKSCQDIVKGTCACVRVYLCMYACVYFE